MPDLSLEWGSDLQLTPAGDLAMVDGSDLTRQRIERRLFTAVRSYVWHNSFGAGLPQRIGRVAREKTIQSIVRSQIGLEASVAKVPTPKISVSQTTANPGLYTISIDYQDAITGVAVAISLELPGSE